MFQPSTIPSPWAVALSPVGAGKGEAVGVAAWADPPIPNNKARTPTLTMVPTRRFTLSAPGERENLMPLTLPR